jgi:hypothetical protein
MRLEEISLVGNGRCAARAGRGVPAAWSRLLRAVLEAASAGRKGP